ncbi:hypothetical protein [Chryseobacterium salviniae]|uniref:Uncharacterized protein n=1 Tax=Chryseobacterium salviniae TaxID=3101750 RepID=A0ABU6HQ61_9FLAO|nr:hypothetical protein [Chryseobacterium sp. T9W2-O]MEC3874613.1 hypothetical protein [Chryseobacterium sp. T9W2-O]
MEKLKFEYLISKRVFNQKINDDLFKIVYNSMIPIESTVEDFSKVILKPDAHSWCGGVFSGPIKNENWIKSSIIGMDFDKGRITLKEVYSKFKEFDIIPNLHYDTFSSSEHAHKFRIVLFFDIPITCIKTYAKIMRTLEKLFYTDPNCKNPSRIFYGGTNINVTNLNPLSLENFIQFIDINTIARDNNLTRSTIDTTSIDANFCNSLYNDNKNVHFLATHNKLNCTSMAGEQVIDWDQACEKIKILNDFNSGEWLYHQELFGLATNLMYMRGGLKKMKSIMNNFNKSGKTKYSKNNFAILPYVKHKEYNPIPVHRFSCRPEDLDIHDIITEVRNIRGRIEIVKRIENISLKEAEEKMISKFNEVISNEESCKTYIFSLPTAIGKTRLLENVENCIVALPTNHLKNEIKGRMNVNYTYSPDTIQFKDPFLNKKIEYFYQIGLPKKSMKTIRNVAEGKYPSSKGDVQLALDYCSQLKLCDNPHITVLSTHKRIINSDHLLHKTVIFDEDPLNTLVEIKTTSIKDIAGVQYFYKPLKSVTDHLASLKEGIYETPLFNIDQDDLFKFIDDKRILETNVFDFLNSKFFIKHEDSIHYIMKKELPKNAKNIILSATIPIEFYKRLYPNIEFESIDIRNVEQVGKVIQYTGRSCSRSGLERYGQIISEEVGDKKVITFQKFKGLFKNPIQDIHFGNCSGYDYLSGKDLTVIGTPHRNNIEYFLLAKLMGVKFDYFKSPFRYQKIVYNGFKFMFNTFDNEELRNIQIHLIESDLIQAVGRARTLRNECIAEVYSGLPLSIADEFIIKKNLHNH